MRWTMLATLVAFAGAAHAAPGVVIQGVNLRAGPDVGYPAIEPLDAGTPVEIYGCLDGWTWCDVAVSNARGWAAGPTLQVLYNNQPVYLNQYGPAVGLGFVGFDVGTYWGQYYRDRPFYADRDRYRGGPGFGGRPDFGIRPGVGGPGPRPGGFVPGRGPGGAPGRPPPGVAPRGPVDPARGAPPPGRPAPRPAGRPEEHG